MESGSVDPTEREAEIGVEENEEVRLRRGLVFRGRRKEEEKEEIGRFREWRDLVMVVVVEERGRSLEMEMEALGFAVRKNTRWESKTSKVWCCPSVALL